MSIYESLRKSRPGMFMARVEANIDPCESCIMADARSDPAVYREHCLNCPVNPDRKNKNSFSSDNFNSKHINSIVIVSNK